MQVELTPEVLASACADVVRDAPAVTADLAALALMYEPDPAAPTVLLFPLSLAAIEARHAEAKDLVDLLNPAEHLAVDSTIELALPDEIEAHLPSGARLRELVRLAVAVLRRELPSMLVFSTDPECTELAESVKGASVPASLSWVANLDPELS